MLCLFFGAIVATATWPWLGPWAALVGFGAAAGLFFGLKFWPLKFWPLKFWPKKAGDND